MGQPAAYTYRHTASQAATLRYYRISTRTYAGPRGYIHVLPSDGACTRSCARLSQCLGLRLRARLYALHRFQPASGSPAEQTSDKTPAGATTDLPVLLPVRSLISYFHNNSRERDTINARFSDVSSGQNDEPAFNHSPSHWRS
jgi:hypothetical protein